MLISKKVWLFRFCRLSRWWSHTTKFGLKNTKIKNKYKNKNRKPIKFNYIPEAAIRVLIKKIAKTNHHKQEKKTSQYLKYTPVDTTTSWRAIVLPQVKKCFFKHKNSTEIYKSNKQKKEEKREKKREKEKGKAN